MSDDVSIKKPVASETASKATSEAVEDTQAGAKKSVDKPVSKPKEFGGRDGPEPTRYGDWENKGIISDF